jgi:hypothetical protein
MKKRHQLHTCTYQNYLEEPPPPRETSERMNFNVIDKKQLIWKLFIYWYLMSFFHKMFGPPLCHLDQWLYFFTGTKKFFSGHPKADPHFRHSDVLSTMTKWGNIFFSNNLILSKLLQKKFKEFRDPCRIKFLKSPNRTLIYK